jgi:hypothetical protein
VATQSTALQKSAFANDTFYLVRQCCLASNSMASSTVSWVQEVRSKKMAITATRTDCAATIYQT